MADDPKSSGDYRKARVGAAAALGGVTVFLLVYDAISPAYEVNVVVLAFLLTSILACLAVDIPAFLRR